MPIDGNTTFGDHFFGVNSSDLLFSSYHVDCNSIDTRSCSSRFSNVSRKLSASSIRAIVAFTFLRSHTHSWK